MNSFMERYGASVKGVVHGWDRLAFRGTLRRISSVQGLSTYLWERKVLLKDFSDWAQSLTARLRRSCSQVADRLGVRAEYLRRSSVDKDALARQIGEEDGIAEGPLCMFSVVEPSLSPTVAGDRTTKRLELQMRHRRCVWVYFYFNDAKLGFGHLRMQTWFPFTIKGCLNGRHWLERSLASEGIDYIKQDNCFRWIGDPVRAQVGPTLAEALGQVTRRRRRKGRSVRALNPSSEQDLTLLRFLAQGQWALSGLRNRDLVLWLDPAAEQLSKERRRAASARASRLLSMLRAHGLIRKVPRTHRYHVTRKGSQVAALAATASGIQTSELTKLAA